MYIHCTVDGCHLHLLCKLTSSMTTGPNKSKPTYKKKKNETASTLYVQLFHTQLNKSESTTGHLTLISTDCGRFRAYSQQRVRLLLIKAKLNKYMPLYSPSKDVLPVLFHRGTFSAHHSHVSCIPKETRQSNVHVEVRGHRQLQTSLSNLVADSSTGSE